MALKRKPTGINVNGAAFLIKDPDAATGSLFTKYQRVPGLASFTLPDETGSSNEVQLQDGTVATAQAAGVGQITGTIGALTAHPTHRLLAKKKQEGGNITVAIVRPAIEVVAGATAASGNTLTFTTEGVISVAGEIKNNFRDLLSEGMAIAYVPGNGDLGTAAFDYDDGTPTANDQTKYRIVVAVQEDGAKAKVGAKYATAVTSAAVGKYRIVRPGQEYIGIACTVSGFGDGDYQAGGVVQGSITLQPNAALPVANIQVNALSDFAESAYDGAFKDL